MTVPVDKIKPIFLAALGKTTAAERAAFLDEACADDPDLRHRVEAMLRAHDQPDILFDRPAVEHLEPPPPGERVAPPEDSLDFLDPPSRPDSLGRIGHYEVLEVLGRGGFGIVLRAFDDTLQRVVAVKVLAPQLAATSPARKRFVREARSSAMVRHENVVQVYAVEEQPLPYLVMEFIPGETLQKRLDRTGPLEVAEVVRIGRQIAEGLAAAHAQGLIHRDIKPGNILIEAGPQQCVKITDFGLARAADDASMTQSGLLAGTPMFMAPEQASGHAINHRADLFSLGSVLYTMCSGRPPFRANSTLAVLKRVAEETPRPIPEIIPEVPQWLCGIVAKLHAKDPAARFQTAREVADLLADREAKFKAHQEVNNLLAPAAPHASLSPSQGRGKGARRKKWAAAAAIVLLPVLALAVTEFAGVTHLFRGQQATHDPRQSKAQAQSKVIWSGWPKDTPPPAIAPFDAPQARAHQEAWAKYFGVPVEYTNSIGMKFRLIPPGEFTMGSTQAEIDAALTDAGEDKHWQSLINSEVPRHKVILTQPIYLGVNVVTQAEYASVTGHHPSFFSPTGKGKEAIAGMDTTGHPVEQVNWNDAVEFCAKLSEREKLKPYRVAHQAGETETTRDTGYRLPTEAEWEFACRAGTTTKYWIGDQDEDLARAGWYRENSGNRIHAVGGLNANPFGLYDLHGNVFQWVQDGWEPSYQVEAQGEPTLNPSGPYSTGRRVIRGGHMSAPASFCRSSSRDANDPSNRYHLFGFRVSLSVDAVKPPPADPKLAKPSTDAAMWERSVAAMPVPDQVQAVSARLKELNPGYSGRIKFPGHDEIDLSIAGPDLRDISPVRAMPGLHYLHIGGANVSDLAPLRGMSLTELTLQAGVSDLSPLQGMMSLRGLDLAGSTNIVDLSPLKGIPLERLTIAFTGVSDLNPIKDMKLVLLNCDASKVSDLSPLKGMPLKDLTLLNTKVSDLSPLKGMSLTALRLEGSAVTDLSPLEGMLLKTLTCDFKAERDATILRAIRSLETINAKPVAEFWKEVDAKTKD